MKWSNTLSKRSLASTVSSKNNEQCTSDVQYNNDDDDEDDDVSAAPDAGACTFMTAWPNEKHTT